MDFNREYAKKRLQWMLDNIDNYDISTFKQHLRDVGNDSDLRSDDDKTDFGFLRNHSNGC